MLFLSFHCYLSRALLQQPARLQEPPRSVSRRLGRPMDVPEKMLPIFKDWRIDHISRDIIPALKAQGVTDDQIRTMMVENPRNLFLGK